MSGKADWRGGGGYSGFQVTGMIKGFFGAVEIFDSVIFFWVA